MTSEGIDDRSHPLSLVLTKQSLTQLINKYLGDFLSKRKQGNPMALSLCN